MNVALNAVFSHLLATGSQVLSGLTAVANNLVPVPSLQAATATTNTPAPAFGDTTSRWSMFYRGHQQGRGSGDRKSSGGSSPSSRPVPAAKIPRLFSRPSIPWAIGSMSEQDTANVWKTSQSPEAKIRSAAITLALARANMIRDLKEARRVHNLALDTFFEPTRIAGQEIRHVEDIEPALHAYLKEATGLDFPELPTWGERGVVIERGIKEIRKDTILTLIQTVRFYEHLRRYLWGVSLFIPGARPGTEKLLLRPEISGDEFSSSRLHEFEHLVGHTNGPLSRKIPRGLFGFGAKLLSLANPLRFVIDMAKFLYEESHAVGAQWELDHRSPKEFRDTLREKWREELKKLELTDQEIDSGPWKFRRTLREKFSENRNSSLAALYFYQNYHQLGFADLPKREYIRQARRIAGYSPIGLFHKPGVDFRFFQNELSLGAFFLPRVVSALQFAGSTAGWVYVATHLLE